MNQKRKFVVTIISAAAVSCLATNTVRDIMQVQSENAVTSKIGEISGYIDKYYLYDVDEETAADYSAMALVASLDEKYSQYYTAEEYTGFMIQNQTSYFGLGITITTSDNNDLIIAAINEDSSAVDAGLQIGDIITAVDGIKYTYEDLSNASAKMRGDDIENPEGTTVTLTIKRGDAEFDVQLERRRISTKTVFSEMLDDEIGYVRITKFVRADPNDSDTSDSTTEEFKDHVNDLLNQNARKLIIDVRDNPGGDMAVVIDIADYLLPQATITYTEDKNGKRQTYTSDESYLEIPIVMLANENSASASEILIGALKDNGAAQVVGKTTYGKGIVQTMFALDDGSAVKLTSARYYTPNGVCIHEKGIEPDVEVDLQTKYSDELAHEDDAQLQKAIELFN